MFQWCFGGSFHFYTFFLFLLIHYFLVYASFLCFPSVSRCYLSLLYVYICLLCRYYIILCYYYITIRYYFIATIRYCTVLLLHVTISCNYYICYYICFTSYISTFPTMYHWYINSLYKDAWICAYVHILIYIQAKIPIIMIIVG